MFSLRRVAVIAAVLILAPAAWAAGVTSEAQSLMSQGKAQDALSLLERHLDKHPQDAEARFARGLALTRLGRTQDAINAFADLTRDYPQLPEPYNNLAVLYAAQGDYERARSALEAALASHPSYATAHENLGDIYVALAGAAYKQALQLDGGNAGVRHKLELVDRIGNTSMADAVPQQTAAPVTAPAPAAAVAPETATPAAAAAPAVPVVAPAAVEAPAEASPAPSASEPARPMLSADDRAAISEAVDAWRSAWASQNLEAYFAAYGADFVPEDGMSIDGWKAQRRDRISAPNRIIVEVENLSISATGPGTASVGFHQVYHSDSFSDAVDKVLDLKNGAGGWKIVREYVR